MAKAALTPEQIALKDAEKTITTMTKTIAKLESQLTKAEENQTKLRDEVAALKAEKKALFTSKDIAKATQSGAKHMKELILDALQTSDHGTAAVAKVIKGVKYPGQE